MEDRVARERPGAALIALIVIGGITAAWWALALWPAGAVEPEWLARTRGACFGSSEGGLPDVGGWLLLVGEPIGMVGLLGAVWGKSLGADLRWAWHSRWWRLALLGASALVTAGALATGVRVARAMEARGESVAAAAGIVTQPGSVLPPIELVDQHGARVSLVPPGAATTIVTFAFGHCATVCPTVVHDLVAARLEAGRSDIALVVVSLDPWRDTPDRLATIARRWGLAPNDRLLSGTVAEVNGALDWLRVGRTRDGMTGEIDHVATVLVVSGQGRVVWRVDGGARGVAELLAGGDQATAVRVQ